MIIQFQPFALIDNKTLQELLSRTAPVVALAWEVVASETALVPASVLVLEQVPVQELELERAQAQVPEGVLDRPHQTAR